MKFLNALPPYFGGKQKLLGKIFSLMPAPDRAPILIDAFLGGGSISLFGKARGYKVLCNDIALRSAVIGRALIENDKVKLTKADIALVLRHNDYHFTREHFPEAFTPEDAEIIDTMMGNIRAMEETTKKYLLLLVIILFILRYRKYGDFGNKWLYRPLAAKENVYLPKGHFNSVRKITKPPEEKLASILRAVNAGVFPNGQANMFFQMDVLEFLAQVRGDIAYFDPPYYGSSSYEERYRELDCILAGEMTEPKKSAFNREGALALIEEMLALAKEVPIWIISYGGPKVEVADILAIVRKFRSAEAVPLNYKYQFGNQTESRNRQTEMLIVARQGG
jgi:adenine-specific DNA methylase